MTLGHGFCGCEVDGDVGLDFGDGVVGLDFLDFGVDEIMGLRFLDLGVLGFGFVNLWVRVITFSTGCILLR